MMNKCIELTKITKQFGNHSVLKNINLSVEQGDFVSIVGKSGSGKSTLLNIIGLLENYTSGTYLFMGKAIDNKMDYSELRLNNIGFIFQNYNLISTMTCKENILLPLLYSNKELDQNYLNELIQTVEIESILDQNTNLLSGGEKQRVAIVRSLILNPDIIIADEPTGNLDIENRDVIIDLLRKQNSIGKTIILITHDLEMAKIAKKKYELYNGELNLI